MFESPDPRPSRRPFRTLLAALLAFALAPVAAALPDGEGGTAPAGGAAKEEKPKETLPPAPAFRCKDLAGKERTLAEFKGKVVVLEWTNHGCPFVKRHYGSGNMQDLQRKYTGKGVVWLTVCSSAEGKEGHMVAKDWEAKCAELKAASTAVLLDPDGTVGHAYGAKATPHMFVVDKDGNLAYQGAIDDQPRPKPGEAKAPRNFVAEAVDAVLAGKVPEVRSTQPYG